MWRSWSTRRTVHSVLWLDMVLHNLYEVPVRILDPRDEQAIEPWRRSLNRLRTEADETVIACRDIIGPKYHRGALAVGDRAEPMVFAGAAFGG